MTRAQIIAVDRSDSLSGLDLRDLVQWQVSYSLSGQKYTVTLSPLVGGGSFVP